MVSPFIPSSFIYGDSPSGAAIETIVQATRAPTSSDTQYVPGTLWINAEPVGAGTLYFLAGFVAGVPQWELLGTSTGDIVSLSDTSGTLVTPTAGGNIQLLGTTNQISVTAGSHTLTFALTGPYTPATFTPAHGVLIGEGTSSIAVTATGSTGQIFQSAGNASDPGWTTATYPATATGTGTILRADGTNWVATTATYPNTATASGILYASATNVIGQIAVANDGALVTSSAGVPSIATSTNGQVMLGSTSSTPAFGTLTTSTGVSYTTGSAALAIDVKQGGYKINAASTGGTIAVQNSYTVTQAAQTSFALPTTAAVGDMFVVASATGNTSGWILTQAASQEIWNGTSHTTNGATGTLAGAIHTSVVLMCTIANLEFTIVGGTGLTGLTFS